MLRCYTATFSSNAFFFFCATLVQLFIFPRYGATVLPCYGCTLRYPLYIYYWKVLCFHVFQLFPFFVFKSFLYALISNYFYYIFFSPDPVLSICPWPPLHSSCSTLIIFNFIMKLGFRIPQWFMQKHTMKVMGSAFPLTRIKFVRQLIYALNLD